MAVAGALDLVEALRRPLWLDEASTFWITTQGWSALLHQSGTEGSPPFYFLIVKTFISIFGTGELAIRLPSILAAVGLIPLVYVLGRVIHGMRTGLIAAGLVTISPLVHYYSSEARNYAVVDVETTAVALVGLYAAAEPRRWRWWGLLFVVEAIALWTHIYAAFVLPCVPLVCIVATSSELRTQTALRATAVTCGAFLVCLPWLRLSMEAGAAGVGDWIQVLWTELPPWAALFRSVAVFSFGAAYPSYLWSLAQAPNIGWAAFAITVAILAGGIIGTRREISRDRVTAVALLGVLPLTAAWIYSLMFHPLYIPGRYDMIVLPFFFAVFATGMDVVWRWRRLAGVAVAVVVGALAVRTLTSSFDQSNLPSFLHLDPAAGRTLGRVAAPGDVVIATSLRQQVASYYAMRSGFTGVFRTFPSEVNSHRGWTSPERMLANPERLQRDATAVTGDLVRAAHQGHRVWLLPSPPDGVNEFLYRTLLEQMEPAPELIFKDAGVVGLKMR